MSGVVYWINHRNNLGPPSAQCVAGIAKGSCTLLDNGKEVPCPGLNLEVFTPAHQSATVIKTKEDGTFEIGLVKGLEYSIQPEEPEYRIEKEMRVSAGEEGIVVRVVRK